MAAALALMPACFLGGLLWGPWLIEKLRELRLGKQIRLEGQEHHLKKQGTPTMGGWLFIVTSAAAMALFVREPRVVLPVAGGMILFGVFGAVDDYVNIKNREGLGLQVRAQFLWQALIAVAIGVALYALSGVDTIRVPSYGPVVLGVWMVPFTALIVLATTAAANLIDGLDGLAAGTSAFAFLAYLGIAALRGDLALVGACAAVIGALLAFLWFNVNPARVFMGGVGSLAIGSGLATVALLSGETLLLPVIALPHVVVALSVIMQVGYFKLTHGKRIFKRAPLQHHFELSGFSEVNIVFRFWLVAAVCAALGLLLSVL